MIVLIEVTFLLPAMRTLEITIVAYSDFSESSREADESNVPLESPLTRQNVKNSYCIFSAASRKERNVLVVRLCISYSEEFLLDEPMLKTIQKCAVAEARRGTGYNSLSLEEMDKI